MRRPRLGPVLLAYLVLAPFVVLCGYLSARGATLDDVLTGARDAFVATLDGALTHLGQMAHAHPLATSGVAALLLVQVPYVATGGPGGVPCGTLAAAVAAGWAYDVLTWRFLGALALVLFAAWLFRASEEGRKAADASTPP